MSLRTNRTGYTRYWPCFWGAVLCRQVSGCPIARRIPHVCAKGGCTGARNRMGPVMDLGLGCFNLVSNHSRWSTGTAGVMVPGPSGMKVAINGRPVSTTTERSMDAGTVGIETVGNLTAMNTIMAILSGIGYTGMRKVSKLKRRTIVRGGLPWKS
jgi:hypothetical protein